MAKQQSFWQRFKRLFSANAHSALDQLEAKDTPKILDHAIREYEEKYSASRSAIAKIVGQLGITRKRHSEAIAAVEEWGVKAVMASDRADQYREQGSIAEAQRYDRLALEASQRQIEAESDSKRLAVDVANEEASVEQLKTGLANTERNLNEARRKRDRLKNQLAVADTKIALQSAADAVSGADPTAAISRAEVVVEERQALAAGMIEVSASTLESQFAGLDRELEMLGAQERLEAIKAGRSARKEIAK